MQTKNAPPAEERRPQVAQIAVNLKAKHPNWSKARCLVEANHIATAPRMVPA